MLLSAATAASGTAMLSAGVAAVLMQLDWGGGLGRVEKQYPESMARSLPQLTVY